jgi:hypothetical protein
MRKISFIIYIYIYAIALECGASATKKGARKSRWPWDGAPTAFFAQPHEI